MKITSLVIAGVLCLATPLLVLGCATDRADQTEMGQLRMPLTATSGSGTSYRLSSAVFDITGPTAGQISADDYVGQPVAEVDLSEGDYELQLQPGWLLEREEAGAFVAVESALKGPLIVPFTIAEGEVSQVQYVFATAGDEVVFGAGQLELSVAVDEVPGQWTCELGYYDAVDGCDCSCGAPDPDCDIAGQAVFGCAAGETCSDEGVCEGGGVCGNGVVEPGEECDDANDVTGDGCDACTIEDTSGWTCDPNFYNALDGCDCACGIPDPDCEAAGQELYNCEAGQVCSSEGLCVAPAVCGNGIVESSEQCDDGNLTAGDGCNAVCAFEGPNGWTCDPTFYDAADGCDCECGTPDPDCEIPGQQVFGCSAGETCSSEGLCENTAVCGNGVVDAGEACDDGNNVVGDGCAACEVEGPAGWLCNGAYYDAADGCDCACGIPDPDCDLAGQQLYNCEAGQVCSTEGLCVLP